MERKEKRIELGKTLVTLTGYAIGISLVIFLAVYWNITKAREVKAEEVQQEQETQQFLCEEVVLTAGSETQLNISRSIASKQVATNEANVTETNPIVSISENQIEETEKVEKTEVLAEESISENEIEEPEGVEIKTTKKVVMYEEANSDSNRIRTLKAGSTLTNVVEVDGGWLKVTYNDTEGYIYYLYTNYLDVVEKVTVEKRRFAEFTPGVVSGRGVNLREIPGMSGEVIDCLKKGTALEVISLNEVLYEEEDGWYLVRVKETNQYGYMYGQYVHIGSKLPVEEQASLEAGKDNVTLLAEAMVAEAQTAGIVEMGYAGQTVKNRADINGTDIRTVLSAPGQYPTTWSKIQNGKVCATPETLELASRILNGEVNCFVGTPLEPFKDLVYFQDKVPHGKNNWDSGVHIYGTI